MGKIGVLGDFMLDAWGQGVVTRLSPEASVPNVDNPAETYSIGGAGNVCAQITALGCQAYAYGVVGMDEDGDRLLSMMEGVSSGLCQVSDRCTTKKLRILDQHGRQLLRLNYESTQCIGKSVWECIYNALLSDVDKLDALIIEDYGKGVLCSDTIQSVISLCNSSNVLTFVDPKDNFWEYERTFLIKPNEKEYVSALKKKPSGILHLPAKYTLVTMGGKGMHLYGPGIMRYIPAYSVDVADYTGAGDTVIAALVVEYLQHGEIIKACEVANLAASIAVTKHGVVPVSIEELEEARNEMGV